jgi:hypothetical protein
MWKIEPYYAGCWAELVMWATFPGNHEFSELFDLVKGPALECINDVQGKPYGCYCNRYRISGPTRWGGSESLVWDSMPENISRVQVANDQS